MADWWAIPSARSTGVERSTGEVAVRCGGGDPDPEPDPWIRSTTTTTTATTRSGATTYQAPALPSSSRPGRGVTGGTLPPVAGDGWTGPNVRHAVDM